MEKIKKTIYLIILSISCISNASSLSYMIKNDEETESYIKLKNEKDNVYLKFYCNNVFNDIKVTIEGLDENDFFEKNYYLSKTIFGSDFNESNWKVSYDKLNKFHLLLDGEGMAFSKNFYNSGSVLIDMESLDSIKLYTVKNKNHLQSKLSSVFENCSIYF